MDRLPKTASSYVPIQGHGEWVDGSLGLLCLRVVALQRAGKRNVINSPHPRNQYHPPRPYLPLRHTLSLLSRVDYSLSLPGLPNTLLPPVRPAYRRVLMDAAIAAGGWRSLTDTCRLAAISIPAHRDWLPMTGQRCIEDPFGCSLQQHLFLFLSPPSHPVYMRTIGPQSKPSVSALYNPVASQTSQPAQLKLSPPQGEKKKRGKPQLEGRSSFDTHTSC
uniref:Uncharacterized protein n=1 Tax=Bionectria ochroleuca TaxID=29856 RepID=A0A8H7N1S7_BIOOC